MVLQDLERAHADKGLVREARRGAEKNIEANIYQ